MSDDSIDHPRITTIAAKKISAAIGGDFLSMSAEAAMQIVMAVRSRRKKPEAKVKAPKLPKEPKPPKEKKVKTPKPPKVPGERKPRRKKLINEEIEEAEIYPQSEDGDSPEGYIVEIVDDSGEQAPGSDAEHPAADADAEPGS